MQGFELERDVISFAFSQRYLCSGWNTDGLENSLDGMRVSDGGADPRGSTGMERSRDLRDTKEVRSVRLGN